MAYVYNDVVSYKISDIPITLEFVEIRKNEMIIEGWFPHYVHLDQEAPNLVLKGNGEIISGEFAARPDEILSAGTTEHTAHMLSVLLDDEAWRCLEQKDSIWQIFCY